MRKVEPGLAPGCVIALHCQNLEPLSQCLNAIKSMPSFIHIKLHDMWAREYQVLKNRTHPMMYMFGHSGYILTAIKVAWFVFNILSQLELSSASVFRGVFDTDGWWLFPILSPLRACFKDEKSISSGSYYYSSYWGGFYTWDRILSDCCPPRKWGKISSSTSCIIYSMSSARW